MGYQAGYTNQQSGAIAIGYLAGNVGLTTGATTGQDVNAIAIGVSAGQTAQDSGAIAIGFQAGGTNQGTNAIAIGTGAGANTQASNGIAIGNNAGQGSQRSNAIALGNNAGQTAQGLNSIAIGTNAGQINQGQGPGSTFASVAIGYQGGQFSQAENAIAIGYQAGQYSQGVIGIGIGNKGRCVAIGSSAGLTSQAAFAVAIGSLAGTSTQGENSIAIGQLAGSYGQSSNSIAIGYLAGQTNQGANSIVINASGTTFATTTASSCFIRPINTHAASAALSMLLYDTTTFEVIRSTASTSAQNKSFVIDHPKDENKYLVHACLEGPESGVYYRGKGEIRNGESVKIYLPNYVDKLATDFTVQITPIYSGKKIEQLYTSEVQHNSFTVYGENCKFFWLVYGKRDKIEVEPLKTNVQVKGSGPYKWI